MAYYVYPYCNKCEKFLEEDEILRGGYQEDIFLCKHCLEKITRKRKD